MTTATEACRAMEAAIAHLEAVTGQPLCLDKDFQLARAAMREATKVTMTRIEIERTEGPSEGSAVPVGKLFTVETWAEANALLVKIANCKRLSGDVNCYDKTDFKVYFADGETYEGRADVKANGEDTNLTRHIREFLGYLAGQWKPAHLSAEDWERVCRNYDADGTAANAREWLATYSFEDVV